MIFPMIFNNNQAAIEFSTVQIPIRISYAIMINKTSAKRSQHGLLNAVFKVISKFQNLEASL